MTATTFTPGTPVASSWLNDVDRATYRAASGVAGTIARTPWDRNAERISVKDFGALGNAAINSGVLSGTNDTAAFNLAIAACGKTKTLYIPDGMYIISPGVLNMIQCSVDGSGATIIGASDTGLGAIFNLGYDETYPVALGTGNTGLYAWKTFKLYQIIGSPNGDAGMSNIGIHCSYLNESQVYVDVIRGCKYGIFLNGNLNNTHQGTNDINIGHLYMCDVGFLGQGGTLGNMCEANRVSGRYWFGFATAAISLAGGGTAIRVDNVFDIISLGVGLVNGNGILLDNLCARNIFRIRSWDSGVSGTGKLIISSGQNNLFQIPALIQANVTMTGTDVIDTLTTATDGSARSNVSMSGIPSSGAWRVGDKVWNTAPIIGNVPGWICTTAGSPGVWSEMQLLAGSSKFKAVLTAPQAISVATPTKVVFGSATINVGSAYNPANGVFLPAVPGYYTVSTSVKVTATTMTSAIIEIYKNGALDTTLMVMPTTLNNSVLSGTSLVYLNGTTDTLSIFGTINAASGASFVSGVFSASIGQST